MKPGKNHRAARTGFPDPDALKKLAAAYRRDWRLPVYLVDPGGELLQGRPACRNHGCHACREARRLAVAESLRWGEPSVEFCPERRLVWAVPLMHNQEIVGGLVSEAAEDRVFPPDPGQSPLDVRGACAALLRMAEAGNLTNAALLELHRVHHGQEQLRAEAIHAFKERHNPSLREVYLQEEQALLDAVRKGDRNTARASLNRVAVAIHFQAGQRLDILKSVCLELAVILSRTAVEAGGNPAVLLGERFEYMAALSGQATEEDLLAWLGGLLNRVMDSFPPAPPPDQKTVYLRALGHMRRHFTEPLPRDVLARAMGVAPAHFSRLFKRHSGRVYVDVLNQMRINRACELLVRTDKELCLLALECGFSDQSYFQKVFRRYTGETPARYRAAHRSE